MVSIEELISTVFFLFASVDLVETGDTMRAAGLEVVADILETEVQFTSLISIILQGFGVMFTKGTDGQVSIDTS